MTNKLAKDLTEEARQHIKPKNFAISAKQSDTGKPAYPIHDPKHARIALGLVGMHGTPAEKAEVRKDVAKKYPGIEHDKEGCGGLKMAAMRQELLRIKQAKAPETRGQKFRSAALADLGPAAGSVLGAGLANAYGINPIAGAAAGYGVGAIPEIVHSVMHRAK